jgi:hypothetical protein
MQHTIKTKTGGGKPDLPTPSADVDFANGTMEPTPCPAKGMADTTKITSGGTAVQADEIWLHEEAKQNQPEALARTRVEFRPSCRDVNPKG